MNEILLKICAFVSILILIKIIIVILLDIFKINYPFKKIICTYRLELLFFVTLFATAASILLSSYFGFAACELCWYQRMFLFTLPIISMIGIIKKDISARIYIFVFSIIGFLFALYHSILQSGIFSKDTVFCNPNALVDCSVPYFTYFGFVTIPVIATSVFALISYLSYVQYKE